MKLQRARKRAQVDKQDNGDTDKPSPVKRRSSLPSSSRGETESTTSVCFFCDKGDEDERLHNASTANIDATVRECATQLRDTKLLARLSSGDMVAIDAVYHLSCMVKLRNRLRQQNIAKQKEQRDASVDALVFAELVGYIEETRQNETIVPVFKLSELAKMFASRMSELEYENTGSCRVHSTRLKERLLLQIPELRAEQQGRDVLMLFKKDIGDAVKRVIADDMDADAVHLVRAAQVVRKHMLERAYEFTGSFENGCELNAVPSSLTTLIRMILEGPNIESQSQTNSTKAHIAVGLSELIQFNTVKSSRAAVGSRHNRSRETPLPIYLSMLIHAKTRKRELVDTFFKLGLCVSYDRYMNISADLANTVCARYHAEEVVCPPQLRSGVFTCGAVDIDHNPSATTSHDSFHGTAISMMQFPTRESYGQDRAVHHIDPEVANLKTIASLPQCYTMVLPVEKTRESAVPVRSGVFISDETMIREDIAKEHQWLNKMQTLIEKAKLDAEDYVSWAAYHASQQPETNTPTSNVALLPLFRDNAHTTCMIKHAMDVISKAVKHLNPTQIPVIVADQPLYAIAKQIQWCYPETHGENRIVVMMGGLHIEMNLLKLLGDWLRESGWTTALLRSELTTSGRADAMLSGAHVTRTRYAHQVTAATLCMLQKRAHEQYLVRSVSGLSFEEWCTLQCEQQPQFKYWTIAFHMQLLLLQFVRSIRERSFSM